MIKTDTFIIRSMELKSNDVNKYYSCVKNENNYEVKFNENEIYNDLSKGVLLRKSLNEIVEKCYIETLRENIKKSFNNTFTTSINNIFIEQQHELSTYEYGKLKLNNLTFDIVNNTYLKNHEIKTMKLNNLFIMGFLPSIINTLTSKLTLCKSKKNLIITSNNEIDLWYLYLGAIYKSANIIKNKEQHNTITYNDIESKNYTIITIEYLMSGDYKECWKEYVRNGLKLTECFKQQREELKINCLWDNMKNPNLSLIEWNTIYLSHESINEYINNNSIKKQINNFNTKKKIIIVDITWLKNKEDEDLMKIYELLSNNRGIWNNGNLEDVLIHYKNTNIQLNKICKVITRSKEEQEIYEYYMRELISNTNIKSNDYFNISKEVDKLMNSDDIIKTSTYLKEKAEELLNTEYECCICSDLCCRKSSVITECGHLYHLKCLNESIKINKSCPLCRQEINNMYPIFRCRSRDKINKYMNNTKKKILISDNINCYNNEVIDMSKLDLNEKLNIIKEFNRRTNKNIKTIKLRTEDRYLINMFKYIDEIIIAEVQDIIKMFVNESLFFGMGDLTKKNTTLNILCYNNTIEENILKKMFNGIKKEKINDS
jgi:hypothetical protein